MIGTKWVSLPDLSPHGTPWHPYLLPNSRFGPWHILCASSAPWSCLTSLCLSHILPLGPNLTHTSCALLQSFRHRTLNRSTGTDFITKLRSIKDHGSISSHKPISHKEMSAKDNYLYEPQGRKFKRTIKTSKNSSLKMIQTTQWTKCPSDIPHPP